MKAEITQEGKLNLIPESCTETYALKKWKENAYIECTDLTRRETGHYKESSISIKS